MHRIFLISLLLCFILEPSASAAPILPQITFNEVMQAFTAELMHLQSNLQNFANHLLFGLGTITVVLTGFALIFKNRMDMSSFMGSMIYLILLLGVLKFFILNGYEVSRDILNSFSMLPLVGNSTWDQSFSTLLDDFFKLIESFAAVLVTKTSLIFVVFLLINYSLLCLFLIKFAITYLIAMFTALSGIIILALGALKITRHLALSYFICVISQGLKLFALSFIFNAGHSIISAMLIAMQSQIAMGQIVRLQEIAMVTFVMMFIVILSYTLPQSLSNMLLHK